MPLGVISLYLMRVVARKSIALKNMINDPIIVELKNWKIYGGRLEGIFYYDRSGFVKLYFCKLLDRVAHRWIDHDKMIKIGNKLTHNPMPRFWIADMKDIFVLPEEYVDRLGLGDTMQIYIDPHYRPLFGVQCDWEPGENGDSPKKDHAAECEANLHEALSFLMSIAHRGIQSDSEEERKNLDRRRQEAFAYIRRRLLMCGARIP